MGISKLDVCFFIPQSISQSKQVWFRKLSKSFGHVATTVEELAQLPTDIIPMVGCSPEAASLVRHWLHTNRNFIYWDRGYFRRQGFTSLPRPRDDGYFRVHLNSFQMQSTIAVLNDRFQQCATRVSPWRKSGRKIVVAEPSKTYAHFHALTDWTERTISELKQYTDRPIRVRKKDNNTLLSDLNDAHALVTHGSIAAVESVIFGIPVFVDQSSAAAHVGKTNLAEIEDPVMPDRTDWLNALAYSQFTEKEIMSGRAFRDLG